MVEYINSVCPGLVWHIEFISAITGIASFIPIVMGFCMYVLRTRNQSKQMKFMKNHVDAERKGAIMCVAVSRSGSIKNRVEEYVKASDKILKNIAGKEGKFTVYDIEHKEEIHGSESIKEAQKDASVICGKVDEKVKKIDMDVDTIHFFCQAPAAVYAMIIARLTKKYNVICYHYDSRKTTYYPLGIIKRENGDGDSQQAPNNKAEK